MSLSTQDKPIALITGVSRPTGLGLETARQLGHKGFRVLITARDLSKVEALAKSLKSEGIDVTAASLDVTSDTSVDALCKMVSDTFGKLDVLINNANSVYDAGVKTLSTDFEVVHQALETTLFGAWRMCKAFVPLLRKSSQARIVNLGSGAGTFADGFWGLGHNTQGVPAYGIAKNSIHALTAKLAFELADSGILVNAVCPGFVATYEGTEAMGARPIPDGAKGIVWAATLPPDGPNGGLFRDGEPIGW